MQPSWWEGDHAYGHTYIDVSSFFRVCALLWWWLYYCQRSSTDLCIQHAASNNNSAIQKYQTRPVMRSYLPRKPRSKWSWLNAASSFFACSNRFVSSSSSSLFFDVHQKVSSLLLAFSAAFTFFLFAPSPVSNSSRNISQRTSVRSLVRSFDAPHTRIHLHLTRERSKYEFITASSLHLPMSAFKLDHLLLRKKNIALSAFFFHI